MAEEMKPTGQPHCRFLTCKEMFYKDIPAGELPHSETGFWCSLTQRIQGPDDKIVGAEECTDERTCFESA
jgi:hypothetical protein